MSSWWRGALKCRLTGWSSRPAAPTSVPCLQVHTLVFAWDHVWVCWHVLNSVCFVGDMSESKAHQVEIREVDGQTLRKLVDYIYTAEIEVTEDNVQVRVFMKRKGVKMCFSFFSSVIAAFTTNSIFALKTLMSYISSSNRIRGIIIYPARLFVCCVHTPLSAFPLLCWRFQFFKKK